MTDINRETAFKVLYEVERNAAYSNLTLNNFIDESMPSNPAFVRELVYGVLREKKRLDYYLDSFVSKGIDRAKLADKLLLRLALYQIGFMDSVPEHSAVDETVKLAKKYARGREGFINGVLRSYIRDRARLKEPTSWEHRYSFAPWIIDLWKEAYGAEETEKILIASNERPELSIRLNLLKTQRDILKKELEEQGFETEITDLSGRALLVRGKDLTKTKAYEEGKFSIQDIASIIATDILDIRPGQRVLDLCSAPGGKTFAMAEKMDSQGIVYAMDKYAHKLMLMEKQALRLGVENVILREQDSQEEIPEFKDYADRVLADVPCSGLGVLRRKPEIKYKEPEDMEELVERQYKILERAASYVKKGGMLMYSTCTINPQENQEQIKKFTEKHKEFQVVYERQLMPYMGVDGFFIAKMMRKEI